MEADVTEVKLSSTESGMEADVTENQRGCGRGLNMEEDGKCCVREVGESRVG